MSVDGLVTMISSDSYTATVERLDMALRDHALIPMLRWDHAAAADDVGLTLRPLLLILFGDPKVGTALMQQNPTAGIDLPLKLLIWEDETGRAIVGYNDPAWIRARHQLAPPPNNSNGMAKILQELAVTAAGQNGA